MIDKVKQGKKNRASGAAFELRTRKDLEEKGWTVDKWSNNVEFIRDVMCKPKLNSSYECERCGNNWGEKDIHPVCQREGKIIPSKRKYAGPGRPMAIGTGFPDFSCHRKKFDIITIGDKDHEPTQEMMQSAIDTMVDFRKSKGHTIVFPNYMSIKPEWEVIGVECKTNGNLDKIEKEKCRWMLDNNTFSKILIAEKTKVKNRVVIIYHDFEEKYGKV